MGFCAGAFLIPYLTMLFVCGLPLFFMEMSLGQFTSCSSLTVFKISPIFKGAGYAVVLINFYLCAYYNVIIAYTLYYMFMSFASEVPWKHCGNWWNTELCKEIGLDSGSHNSLISPSNMTKTPTHEFFHNYILEISEGIEDPGPLVWKLVLCVLLSWFIVFLCISRGVQSVGKVVYFTATFPFLMLFALLIRGVTLPGAVDGILFYITPKWEKLLDFSVWSDAAVQIFYSLGPGWGGLITMASYNKFNNNIQRDSVFVPIMNCGTSIFAGFVVFSVLGFMSHQTGIPVKDVATAGPSLAFVTYPEAIAMMPLAPLWAVLFFFMLYTLGLDSEAGEQFVQVETIIAAVLDEYPRYRKYKLLITAGSCCLLFLLSLSCVTKGGMYVLQLFDWYCANVTVPIVCFCEICIVAWIYGVGKFVRDVEFMIGKVINFYWRIAWLAFTPIALVIILGAILWSSRQVVYENYVYPDWAVAVGWMIAFSSVLFIPIYAAHILWNGKGSFSQRLKRSAIATEDYGPGDSSDFAAWKEHCASTKYYWLRSPIAFRRWLKESKPKDPEEN
ncbi:unnamed protein product [Darwinula stevensoni]|uniref:Uncharacterized protein n=1 Tax=Darwinula stevensoni TaxID=69355 RepID=A0A7R8XEQ2_9CRUS|nr:unnamed protein product [Darwinula stevensoni]CAG0895521.1 unnamed protein product [Darwinula stevensoni]